MGKLNVKTYQRRAARKKKSLAKFLRKLGNSNIRGILKVTAEAEKEVWNEVGCLDCANCCKKMTPTYTRKDINRIAKHFDMTYQEFFDKWLRIDENKDIINVSIPCQFLDKRNNKCKIYEIRPDDCAGFPHFNRRDIRYQIKEKTYLNNITYCPATLRFVEKLEEKLSDKI